MRINNFFLLGTAEQPEKGSPVKPVLQVQTGVWFTTLQTALKPHDPGQGSRHFSFWQAKFPGHSSFMTHSGLQFGGLPTKLGKQEQAGVLPTIRH